MSRTFSFNVSPENEGERLDKFLSEQLDDVSRTQAAKLIEQSHVTVNADRAAKNYKCRTGDVIGVEMPEPVPLEVSAENIPLDIVFEDNDLLVVNKPKGMVVHPAAGNYTGTLVNALLYHCKGSLSGINGVLRPGIVHRIDKDTSGLLIVAKNDRAHAGLAAQIKAHSFERAYECVAHGNVQKDEFTVSLPIGRDPKNRKKMAVVYKNSKPAVTHAQVIKRFGSFTHLRCKLETGRTHQIRVHLSYIGHPIAGDAVYGPKKAEKDLNGQCLHAKHIAFTHPITGERLAFESELPEYFTRFLNKLENKYNLL